MQRMIVSILLGVTILKPAPADAELPPALAAAILGAWSCVKGPCFDPEIELAVEEDRPWHAHQLDTSVLAEHRGHRLGLLLKGSMVHWLAEAEPQLLEVDTWNAASNAHMIAVNDRLGYQVVATATCYQTHV